MPACGAPWLWRELAWVITCRNSVHCTDSSQHARLFSEDVLVMTLTDVIVSQVTWIHGSACTRLRVDTSHCLPLHVLSLGPIIGVSRMPYLRKAAKVYILICIICRRVGEGLSME